MADDTDYSSSDEDRAMDQRAKRHHRKKDGDSDKTEHNSKGNSSSQILRPPRLNLYNFHFETRKGADAEKVSFEESGVVGKPVFSKHHSEKLEDLLDTFHNNVMMRRCWSNTVESLALLAMARAPVGNLNDLSAAKSTMDFELRRFYEAADPKKRKFLLYTHFRLACELRKPGSVNKNNCSLCNLEGIYNCYSYLDHFHKFHTICPRYFQCDIGTCKFGTRLPSKFKEHIESVHQERVVFTDSSLQPHIVDAFADFVSLRTAKHSQMFLIKPGVPTTRPTTNTKTVEDKKERLMAQGKRLRIRTTIGVQTKNTTWTSDLDLKVQPGSESKLNWKEDCMLVSQVHPTHVEREKQQTDLNGPKVVLKQTKLLDKRSTVETGDQPPPKRRKK